MLDAEILWQAMNMDKYSTAPVRSITCMGISPRGVILTGYNFYTPLPLCFFPRAAASSPLPPISDQEAQSPPSREAATRLVASVIDLTKPVLIGVGHGYKGDAVVIWLDHAVLLHPHSECAVLERVDLLSGHSQRYALQPGRAPNSSSRTGWYSPRTCGWAGGHRLFVRNYDVLLLVDLDPNRPRVKQCPVQLLLPADAAATPLTKERHLPLPLWVQKCWSCWIVEGRFVTVTLPATIKTSSVPLQLRPDRGAPGHAVCACLQSAETYQDITFVTWPDGSIQAVTRRCSLRCPPNLFIPAL
jgi:hypothetical protein